MHIAPARSGSRLLVRCYWFLGLLTVLRVTGARVTGARVTGARVTCPMATRPRVKECVWTFATATDRPTEVRPFCYGQITWDNGPSPGWTVRRC